MPGGIPKERANHAFINKGSLRILKGRWISSLGVALSLKVFLSQRRPFSMLSSDINTHTFDHFHIGQAQICIFLLYLVLHAYFFTTNKFLTLSK